MLQKKKREILIFLFVLLVFALFSQVIIQMVKNWQDFENSKVSLRRSRRFKHRIKAKAKEVQNDEVKRQMTPSLESSDILESHEEVIANLTQSERTSTSKSNNRRPRPQRIKRRLALEAAGEKEKARLSRIHSHGHLKRKQTGYKNKNRLNCWKEVCV